MKASVLGCGRWGSFLAWYLSAKGDVVLWGRESGGSYRRLRETGGNEYLRLPENVRLTSDLGEAMASELIVISIGAQGLRAFTEELKPYGLEHKTVLLCMKGLEEETGARLSEIVNGAGVPPERFPYLRKKLTEGKQIRVVAVEPQSCPKLTRGTFQYDFGDTVGLTPLIPMYTLGHNFEPANIHAGGLRYHGAGAIVSQLLKDRLIEAVDMPQLETFEAGVLFARTEGIIPAPESTHAIAQAIREAQKAKEEGKEKTILFNLSGHGMIDLYAYEQYFAGNLQNYTIPDSEITCSLKDLEKII